MKYINRHFLSFTANPYYLWKIDIPEEISVEFDCTGSIYKDSGGEQERVTANLSWKLGRVEGKDLLIKGEGNSSFVNELSLKVKGRERVLWPSLFGRHREGILINHVGGGVLNISLNQWVRSVLSYDESQVKDMNLKSTLYCQNTELSGLNRKMIYQSGLVGREEYRWELDEEDPLEVSVYLRDCPFEEGQKEITCTLKVVINNL